MIQHWRTLIMSNDQGKWKETTGQAPNLEGTELDKVLSGLKQLLAHYERELQKDVGNLAIMEQALKKWELQKKKRKVDPNG